MSEIKNQVEEKAEKVEAEIKTESDEVDKLSPPKEEQKVFRCSACNLHSNYSYYGTRPLERNETVGSENKSQSNVNRKENIILLEKCYVCDDPFAQNKYSNYLILGSNCVTCNKMVCVSSECSIFYYKKRFCIKCASQYLNNDSADEFPIEIKAELLKLLNSKSNN
jgi:hypothetical protein